MAEKKTVILDDNRTAELEVPHDCNSTFEPLIIPKHEKRAPLFNYPEDIGKAI